MAKNLAYHPLFESDVREAAAWYDRQRAGLGARFVASWRGRGDDRTMNVGDVRSQ